LIGFCQTMKIAIGTENKIKISALAEVIADYDFLAQARICEAKVSSGVDDQPKNLPETARGAKNRARAAFAAAGLIAGDFAVGIEDGLMEVGESLTGFMNIGVCAIYDGEKFHLGTSAAFEYPPAAVELVKQGMDINQAFHKLGLTKNPSVGSSEGAIGILTRGRWDRKATVKQALTAALIQLENKSLY